MTYSTGSGTYVDLMAAVLAHAIADGWTTSGGNWPISKGNVRGVDWQTTTRSVTDYTSGSGVALTERIIRLAIGTSLADATSKAGALTTSVLIPCMNFAILDWHIFSDPGAGKPDYIHVVTRYSNGINAELFNHFSFGELEKGGMTYGSLTYVASHARRGYIGLIPSGSTQAQFSYDFNCANQPNWPMHFGGSSKGNRGGTNRQTTSENNIQILINPTSSPVPGTGGWLQPNILGGTDELLDALTVSHSSISDLTDVLTEGNGIGISSSPGSLLTQPYTGGVSFQSLPAILLSGSVTNTSPAMFLGVFPGVRLCTMQSYNSIDEITYASDTWKLMPLLRKTPVNQALISTIVSSAEVGYAYKKVP
jgi:hypothetical protein